MKLSITAIFIRSLNLFELTIIGNVIVFEIVLSEVLIFDHTELNHLHNLLIVAPLVVSD